MMLARTHWMSPFIRPVILAVLCAPLFAGGGGSVEISFADLGKSYLKSHGNAPQATDLPPDKIFASWCCHIRLGAFDLAYPISSLSDKQHVDILKALCSSLLEMQARWIDWLAEDPAKTQGAQKDLSDLQTWVKSWRPPALAHVTAEDKDLFKLLSATEAQVQAAARLDDLLCKPDVLGVAPKEGKPVRIFFAPTRRDFVELLGYAGLLDPAKQAELWQQPATEWTTFWIGWDLVMALEYPPWASDPQFRTGLPMDKFDKNGLEQHAVQQAANAWQWFCYGDDGAPYFHQALAMNLAIAVCGELNALEGDGWGFGTTGGRTNPYEKFVPGGNPAGGTLPPMPAAALDSLKKGHWRENLGKDHFALPLRKGQKNGLKQLPKNKPEHLDASLLEDKSAHFLLISPDESTKYVVSAPFLGTDAQAKPYPPNEVILDYREFFRAYKCAFIYWLQTLGDPKDAAASAARFRTLVRKAYERDTSKPFDDLVQEIYGAPLSGKNGKTDSLEWRFLEWLAKGH